MPNNFKILSPINGDMLHANDGALTNGQLTYTVSVAASETSIITINDNKTIYNDGVFRANINFDQYQNNIVVKDETSGEMETISVNLLTNFAGKYRLSIDDNIWFLEDLYNNDHRYSSIFDNPYLAFLKKLHDTYGTKIHINIFYQIDGFNISQLSDRFRDEWSAQSNWIRLCFHALQEFPDMPYKDAGYDEVKRDCELVKKEIKRFAGEAVMGPVITIHWGEANVEGSRALRDSGYKGQLGYFNVDDDRYPASYYLSVEQRRHLKKRFIWRDPAEDIIFIKTSIVIDKTDLNDIVPFLNHYETRPPYLDLLVHEQYYYPFYQAYEPDYCERIETAIKWAIANNYTPEFLGDCIFK